MAEAIVEFKKLMTAAGHTVDPKVIISSHVLPSKSMYVHLNRVGKIRYSYSYFYFYTYLYFSPQIDLVCRIFVFHLSMKDFHHSNDILNAIHTCLWQPAIIVYLPPPLSPIDLYFLSISIVELRIYYFKCYRDYSLLLSLFNLFLLSLSDSFLLSLFIIFLLSSSNFYLLSSLNLTAVEGSFSPPLTTA